ncbi:MAG TPA: ClbS/DfsB family four-helix bundle protein [Acidobacteriota bacterium]|nr:ClbS/DfsB family four-helix bundle protein [Acidobacteriota bacterium]
MNIEDQIEKLNKNVQALSFSLASLDEDHFLMKLNGWSSRDIVAHLIGWNRAIVQGSRQILKAELPFYDVDSGENYSKVNADFVRNYSSTDLQEMVMEMLRSADELSEFLKTLNEKDWSHDFGVKNKGLTITIKSTVDDLIEDYAHHTTQIEKWKNAR